MDTMLSLRHLNLLSLLCQGPHPESPAIPLYPESPAIPLRRRGARFVPSIE